MRNQLQKRSSELVLHQDLQEPPDADEIITADEELSEMHQSHLRFPDRPWPTFPPECLRIVRLIKGNNACVDCQGFDEIGGVTVEPMFASTTHGTALCRNCAEGHQQRDERAFGIKAFIDSWYFPEVLSLMEGGNTKFKEFCAVTNSYPTLQSAIDDRTQFIDALYSCNPVKAYRSLLRRAVAKVENDRRSLMQVFLPDVQEIDHPSTSHDLTIYSKELPMLSVHDFYTYVLGKKWPNEDESSTKKSSGTTSDVEENQKETSSQPNNGNNKKKISRLSVDDPKIKQENFNSKRIKRSTPTLSAVPEAKLAVDSDDISIPSSSGPITTIPATRDDDVSVQSFGSFVASSVGSLSLKSVDSCSVTSADLEPLPKINKEDELVKKLEPNQTQNMDKDVESVASDTIYGPQTDADSARNILELEQLSRSQPAEDEKSSTEGQKSNSGVAIINRSSLESTMQKLTESLKDGGASQEVKSLPVREKGKTIGFKDLPSSPPERTTSRKKITRVRPVDGTNLTRGAGFRRGRRTRSSNQISLLPREGRSSILASNNGKLSRPSTETKAREKSDYTPLIRHSALQRSDESDKKLANKDDGTPVALQMMTSAYRHQWKRISRSFEQQGSKDQNSFGKDDNLAPKREDDANFVPSTSRRNLSLDENQLRLLSRRPLYGQEGSKSELQKRQNSFGKNDNFAPKHEDKANFVPSISRRNLSLDENQLRVLSRRSPFNQQGSKSELQKIQNSFGKNDNFAPTREDEGKFVPSTSQRNLSEDENWSGLRLLSRRSYRDGSKGGIQKSQYGFDKNVNLAPKREDEADVVPSPKNQRNLSEDDNRPQFGTMLANRLSRSFRGE
mmetsp:Transcript_26373/g.38963  ORF Transcript_26373/g.38963 Transcript_26373/m.38963 type:complete len:846 (+) Transcript_26373:128-2665(+)